MDVFYFVILCGNSDTITVIDLARCVDYERSDWNCIDNIDFKVRDAAIVYAREVAKANGLKYKPFESRYDSSTNEPKLSLITP